MIRIARAAKQERIGCAVGRTQAVALWLDGARRQEVLLFRDVDPRSAPLDVRQLVAEIAQAAGSKRTRLSIALLPDLCQLRRLQMPPLRDDELRLVLTRDASRYFPSVTEQQTIAVQRPPSKRRESNAIVAAAAPAGVVSALYTAAAEQQLAVDRIVPAFAAWACAVVSREPRLLRESCRVAVAHREQEFVMHLRHGRSVLVRRSHNRTVLHEEDPPDIALNAPGDDAAQTAALFADRVDRFRLVPDDLLVARDRRAGRLARVLAAAAAACLVISAVFDLWGLHRELAHVASARAALADRVGRAMHLRDSLGTIERRVQTLAALEQTTPLWSYAIATVASNLPLDAHLAGFRGRLDSLFLDGTAERASRVFEAMQSAPEIDGVRATAPIRRDAESGQRTLEHFSVALRLDRPAPRTERHQ